MTPPAELAAANDGNESEVDDMADLV